MSKAYKCDKCGKFHDGNSDMQVSLDHQSEIILRHTLGVKFSPEMQDAQIYLKDMCNDCSKAFCDWWKDKEVKHD